jgi:hypothetical protein
VFVRAVVKHPDVANSISEHVMDAVVEGHVRLDWDIPRFDDAVQLAHAAAFRDLKRRVLSLTWAAKVRVTRIERALVCSDAFPWERREVWKRLEQGMRPGMGAAIEHISTDDPDGTDRILFQVSQTLMAPQLIWPESEN